VHVLLIRVYFEFMSCHDDVFTKVVCFQRIRVFNRSFALASAYLMNHVGDEAYTCTAGVIQKRLLSHDVLIIWSKDGSFVAMGHKYTAVRCAGGRRFAPIMMH
jgi:hypothetical protein